MKKRESIEWCNIWVTHAERESLPRVLLIGDSIAQSYYPRVETALGNKFACARLTTSKCLCDPAYPRELRLVLDEYAFAVIHFNNGLHGWSYSDASYKARFPKTIQFIREHAPTSKLIWASSTPLRVAGALSRVAPATERVRARNSAARAALAKLPVPVNDLFALVIDRADYYADDGTHFNAAGQAALGDQVAQAILREFRKNTNA